MAAFRSAHARSLTRLWPLWLAAVVLFGYGHLTRVAPGGMIDVLMRDFAVSAAALGNISSMYWYAYAAVQIPGGALLDRFSVGRVMAASAALCVIGGLLFALAPDVATANIGRFVTGAGGGVLYAGCIKLARDWFPPARFTLLGGITVLVGMLGAALGQAPLAAAVELGGWRTVMLVVALVALPFALLMWWRMPAGARDVSSAPSPAPVDMASIWRMLGRTLRTREVWIATVMAVALGTPAISFALWTVGYYMQVHDHTRPAAATFTSIALLGWAAGSLLVGWVSGRIGRRKPPAIACALLALVGWSVFVAVPDIPLAAHYVLMVALGLSAGGIVVSFALVAEHGPARGIGMSTGVANSVVMMVSALVQLLMGAILDWHWEGAMRDGVRFYPLEAHQQAFVVMPVLCVVALGASLLVRETHGHAQPQ